MTVKLLMDWPDSRNGKNYLAGNLLTTDAGTESGLVAAKMATSTLSGGTDYVPPVAQRQRHPVESEFDPITGRSIFSAGETSSEMPLRTTPLRVATFGDSTANTNSTICAQDIYTTTFAAHVANSQSPERWQLPTFYPQAHLVANGGISGETTTNMLARETAAISATRKSISDVIDLRPDVVLLRAGSINNVLSVTSGTLSSVVATCYAEHCQIINRFLDSGVIVIDEGIIGTDGTGATELAACLSAIQQLNTLFAAYAKTVPNVYFKDWTGILHDGSGLFSSGIAQQDGLGRHAGLYAQSLIAREEAEIVSQVFGNCKGPRYQGPNVLKNAAVVAANLNNNSLFASYQPGGGFGGYPTGCSVGVSQGVRQNGKVEVIDGKLYYTVENAATAANNYLNIYLPIDIANFVPAIGDIYGMEMDIIIGGVTNSTPPTLDQMIVKFDFTSAGQNIAISYQVASVSALPIAGYFKAHVTFPPFQFPLDTGVLTAVEAFVQAGTDEVVTWKLGVAMPRLVKI